MPLLPPRPFRSLRLLRPFHSMMLFALLLLSGWLGISSPAQATEPVQTSASACPTLLQHTFPRLQDDAPQSLCQYTGKVLLIVNTASYCGFTGQYQELEALFARYKDRGLVIIGFPSNDFGQQEPGNSKQIADLCYNTYGVKFPMMAKSHVRGDETNPLYIQLAQQTGTPPKWNFHKYLIDRKGQRIESHASAVSPLSRPLTSRIEALLAEQP